MNELQDLLEQAKGAMGNSTKILEGLYFKIFEALEEENEDYYYKYLHWLNNFMSASQGNLYFRGEDEE